MKDENKALPLELTEEEVAMYDAKCEELAKKHDCYKVHVCVQFKPNSNNERVVSYFKEPNRMTKLAMMNKVGQLDDQYAVGEEIMNMCIIKEESDQLVTSTHQSNDIYYLGAVQFCIGIITLVTNRFKKK